MAQRDSTVRVIVHVPHMQVPKDSRSDMWCSFGGRTASDWVQGA